MNGCTICMSTTAERRLTKNIVATISIERIPEHDIIDEIYNQTKKTIDSLLSVYQNFDSYMIGD